MNNDMKKVKVTQEQANWLARYDLTQDQIDHFIDMQTLNKRPDSPIADWELSKLAKALYIGYEVEPKFKEDDWVVRNGNVVKINCITRDYSPMTPHIINVGFDHSDAWYNYDEIERHATDEEIAKQKEINWWAKYGREPWELKQGDVLMGDHREIFEITADPKSHRYHCYRVNDEHDITVEGFKRDNWEVVCFVEDRRDL